MVIDAIDRLLVAGCLERVNGAFLGFWVTAGFSKTSAEYHPSSFRIGSYCRNARGSWRSIESSE